jgi:AraC-like DNA-binding protein
VTAASPLQYLKSVGLHKARIYMVQDGLNSMMVADMVGYGSTSQFCREFKRQFGKSPAADATMMRKSAAIQ